MKDTSTKRSKGLILVVAGALLLLLGCYTSVVFSPFDYQLAGHGDGYKNYYTLIYHVAQGGGTHFKGMGYPYAEHIVYTDNQPALAYIFSLIQQHFTKVDHLIIGIQTLLILGCFLLTAILVYKLVSKLLLPVWYTVGVSLLITFMSPQMIRSGGHFALAYSFFVPALWLMILSVFAQKKINLMFFFMIAMVAIMGFIHPYYILIGIVFQWAYAVVDMLQYRATVRAQLKFYGMYFLFTLLPIILFQGWLKLTDNITDRPSSPVGFLTYTARFDSVFLQPYGPVNEFLNRFMIVDPSMEGWAFVGTIGLVVLLYSIRKVIQYGQAKNYQAVITPALPPILKTSIWTAVLVLLYAMGFPFRLYMEFLLDLLPPLKQFRSIGRFAWIFYYIFSVYAAYVLYLLYLRIKTVKPAYAYALLIAATAIWSIETGIHIVHTSASLIHPVRNSFNKEKSYWYSLQQHGYTRDSFQAIMPIPYCVIGTEKIDTYNEPNYESFVLSYQSSLPLNAIMLSRYSAHRGIQLKQMLSHDLIPKEVFRLYQQNKPVLVFVEESRELTEEEIRFLGKCRLLYKENGFAYYTFYPATTKTDYIKTVMKVNALCSLSPSIDSTTSLSVNWEDSDRGQGFFSAGKRVSKEKREVILNPKIFRIGKDSANYEASLWCYVDFKQTRWVKLIVKQHDAKGNIVEEQERNITQSYDIMGDQVNEADEVRKQYWVRLSVPFVLKKGNSVSVELIEKNTIYDRLLIMPVPAQRCELWQTAQGRRPEVHSMNNYPY